MITHLATALLLAFTARAQEPSADGDWIPLDGVAAVINDEIIKESELDREFSYERERLQEPITTAEELDRFHDSVRSMVVKRRLRTQAGEELGLVEEEVERIVDDHLGVQRERKGLLSYIGYLSSRGLGEHEIHSQTRRQFYQETWEDSVRGETAAGKRPRRDRFVRPGEMYVRYLESMDAFADPPEVRLRQFVVLRTNGETESDARARCAALRDRVELGDPLERILLDAPPAGTQTNAWTVTADRLPPNLIDFAIRAPVGTTTPVGEMPLDKGQVAYGFIAIEERREIGPPRPFLDGAVQSQLTRWVLSVRDREHLEQGEEDLIESAYIAPPLAPSERSAPEPR